MSAITITADNYVPSTMGVISFYIPRLHISVTEEELMDMTRYQLSGVIAKSDINLAADVRKHLGSKQAFDRIDFKPIYGNDHFKSGFVYMTPVSQFKELSHGNQDWLKKSQIQRIAYDVNRYLFECEAKKEPVKIEFIHKNKKGFWMLLPNRNPLTGEQKDIADSIGTLTESAMDMLYDFTMNNIRIPNSIDTDFIVNPTNEETRLSTAVMQPHEVTIALKEKYQRIHDIHRQLVEHTVKNSRYINANADWADYYD